MSSVFSQKPPYNVVSQNIGQSTQQTAQYLQKQLSQIKSSSNNHKQDKIRILGIQKNTPLRFKFKVKSGFIISYKQSELKSSIIKILAYTMICIILTFPLSYYHLSEKFKAAILICMYSIPLLYSILFFLDPGTLVDDEDQNFYEERIFCTTCQIYRNISTKHCSFCNRCCRKYDHHCSVFGKCIGKRNKVLFYLLIFNTSLTFIFYFIASLYQLIDPKAQIPNKK